MKRNICLLLCAALLLSLFAGCSAEHKPYVPTGNGLTYDDGSTKPAPTQEPEKEQELALAYYASKPMNPLQTTDFTNYVLFSLMYQGLFCVDRDYEVHPVLCKEYSVSKDMKTFVFYIEQATFSDGTLLTAEDVYASLEYASRSQFYRGRFAHVINIALSTDGGVVVETDTPCESLPMLLTIPIIKKDDLHAENPVGTGPYYLETVSSGLRLRRRTNWWCEAEIILNASSIPLVSAESPSEIRDNFEFYDVGLVCADPCSDTYADFRCDYELWDCENGAFLYIGCNTESPIFSNPSVRSALTYAIDRDYLVEKYYRGFGRAATLPASPSSPYYSRSLAKRYAYDPQKFTQALGAASMLGATVRILVNKDDSLRLSAAKAIGKMLEACGLIVQIREYNTLDFKNRLNNTEFYDIYVGLTRLSANMDLSSFFRKGGSLRYGGMTDTTLYNFCQQALANEGNYYNLHKAVADDGRITSVLFHSYAVYATRGLLTGITPARENVFYYQLDKEMADCQIDFVKPEYVEQEDDRAVFIVTASSGLNMRAEPSTSGALIVRLPYKAKLTPDRWENGWAYVEFMGYYGWVSGKYLEEVEKKN